MNTKDLRKIIREEIHRQSRLTENADMMVSQLEDTKFFDRLVSVANKHLMRGPGVMLNGYEGYSEIVKLYLTHLLSNLEKMNSNEFVGMISKDPKYNDILQSYEVRPSNRR